MDTLRFNAFERQNNCTDPSSNLKQTFTFFYNTAGLIRPNPYHNSHSEELMKTIKAPVFIIIGNAYVVRPEHIVVMYRLLPYAKLAILPGGHEGYIGEITTPPDSTLIAATVSMINKFPSVSIANWKRSAIMCANL